MNKFFATLTAFLLVGGTAFAAVGDKVCITTEGGKVVCGTVVIEIQR